MALAKQKVPIAFGQGIDTKTDKRQAVLGKLRRAENVVFETLQGAKKRYGYDSIPLEVIGGGSVSGAKILTKFNTELNLLDSTTFYSYSPSIQKLQSKGSIYAVHPTSKPVIRNSEEQFNADSAFVEGLKIFTWESSAGEVRYSVQDADSNSFVVSNDLVASSSERPKAVVLNNYVYIIYITGQNLNYRRFNILAPSTLETQVNLASDADATYPILDAITVESKIIVAYNATGPELTVFGIYPDETLTSMLGITGADASNAIDVSFDDSFRIIVTYASSTEVNYVVLPFTLAGTLLAETTIETIADVTTVTSCVVSGTNYQALYEVSATSPTDHFIKKNTMTFAGTVGTPEVFLRSVGLATKCFDYNGAMYHTVSHDSTLQSTYFIVDNSGVVVAKVSPLTAGGHIESGALTQVSQISDSQFLFASQIKGRNVSENGTFFSLLGVNGTVLEFNPETPYQNTTLGPNMHISGGILQMYDGDEIVEHGFHLFPETLGDGSQSTSGQMADGDYSYIAVYAWTDNQGQIHRSAESLALDVTVSGGGNTASYDIEVPTLRLTQKSDVILELYRTEDAGTIYYKVTSVSDPELNDSTQDSVTINDTLSDADLISKEALYTTGGVLENIPAPSCSIISTHTASNRVVIAGLEDPNLLQYSKIRFESSPVEFNDTLVKPVDPIGGKITALFNMDEKIIIFEEDAIFYISGVGPNNLGEQDTFTEPERISIDVGCIDPQSLVLTPEGIMFKSRKGIYLLDRGLGLSYVGAPVEEFNDLTISSAKIVAEFNQVRFTTADNVTLVYNYHLQLWATFTNHRALSSEVIGNDYYYIRSDSELYKQNTSSFSDNGSSIKMLLETGWMSFNELQGFMRAYKLLVLGEYKSPHLLRIRFAYNFNEAWVQEKVIDTSDFIDGAAYGDDSPYGSPEDEPYASDGNVYQARVDLKTQKCQSIKILIEDIQSEPGEGLFLSAMTLEIGGKTGIFKVQSNKKYGSS